VANLPPANEKRYWQRYIYLWIKYALFEELMAGDQERAREVYRTALKIVPHSAFTFSKVRASVTIHPGYSIYRDTQPGPNCALTEGTKSPGCRRRHAHVMLVMGAADARVAFQLWCHACAWKCVHAHTHPALVRSAQACAVHT
jgi:hypothetical protein